MTVILRRLLAIPGLFSAGATLIALAMGALALNNHVLALVLGIVGGGCTVAQLIVGSHFLRRKETRNLELDARGLASEIRALCESAPAWTAERSSIIVENYTRRFEHHARRLAKRFQNEPVPQTDALFQTVDQGPKDEIEVWQIAAGLERLARCLPD